MDKLARRLRDDAERIECQVSPQLDERIRASLQNTRPEQPRRRPPVGRPLWFWLGSSLTGIAAALAIVAVLDRQVAGTDPEATDPVAPPMVLPSIQWNARTAVLTSPLEQEYQDLQSDLRKAEEAVRQDIERLF